MDLVKKVNKVYCDVVSLCLKTIRINYMRRTGRPWGLFVGLLEVAEVNGETFSQRTRIVN
jgi:hypothetical protein